MHQHLVPKPRDETYDAAARRLFRFRVLLNLGEDLFEREISQMHPARLLDQLPAEEHGGDKANVAGVSVLRRQTHRYAVIKPDADQLPLVNTAKPFVRRMIKQKNRATADE